MFQENIFLKRNNFMSIYLTSDWHINHDKEFIYEKRGFSNVNEMNDKIIENYNSIITNQDTVYMLGDLCLGTLDKLKESNYLENLNGNIKFIIGNHDSDEKINYYKQIKNIEIIGYATYLKYKKYRFYLSHYPTITSYADDKKLKSKVLNLYGHTHQTEKFYNNNYTMFHVGVDSNNLFPINIDDIIEEIKDCKEGRI